MNRIHGRRRLAAAIAVAVATAVHGQALTTWDPNHTTTATGGGGGDGTWSLASDTWSDSKGLAHGAFQSPATAVFGGAAGTVIVDDSEGNVAAGGLHFDTDHYHLSGDAIELVGTNGEMPKISQRPGTSRVFYLYTAVIDNVLTGHDGLANDVTDLYLNGHNTYSGGTLVTNTVHISSEDNLGTGNVFLNGTLAIEGAGLKAITKDITIDFGEIVVADAANTVTIDGSKLHYVNAKYAILYLDGPGAFNLKGPGNLVGTLLVGSRYATTLYTDSAALRNITRMSVASTLVIDQSVDDTWYGEFESHNLVVDNPPKPLIVKRGTGNLVLARYSSSYDGDVHVDEGTLTVGNAPGYPAVLNGTILVGPNGTIAGNGILGSVTYLSNGVIYGGRAFTSQGTVAPLAGQQLVIGGNATLAPGSKLLIGTVGNTAAQLYVNGHATITGSNLVVQVPDGAWADGVAFQVMHAGGGLDGTFASATTDHAFIEALAAYGANGDITVVLRRDATGLQASAATPNGRAAAAALVGLGAAGSLYDTLFNLDAPSARTAFSTLAGDLHASVEGVVMDSQRQVRDAVMRHVTGADTFGGARADDGHVSTWVSVLGRDGDYDGDANSAKVDASGSGLLLGADVTVGEAARIGAVVGHSRGNLHQASMGGSADIRGNHVGVYGDVMLDGWRVSGGAVRAHHAIDTRRDVVVGADASRAYGSRDADTTQAFAELGYRFGEASAVRVEPFIQAAVVRWQGDSAHERSAVGALVVGSDDARVTTGQAGMHLGTALDGEGRFGLQATLAWQRAWGDTTPAARLRFAEGGAGFTSTGAPLTRNAGLVDAGIVVRLAPKLHLDASYAGQFAGKVSDHGGRVSLNMTF